MPRSPPPPSPSYSPTVPPPPDYSVVPPPPHSSSGIPSFVIVVIVISSAVFVSVVLYRLLRWCRRSQRTFSVVDDVIVANNRSSTVATSSTDLVSSLPSFTFGSVAGTLTGGDCAVCLGKFERSDLLRLLPLCCHAFHAECVDTWLVSNLTCPLCRSSVHPSEEEVLDKILSQTLTQSQTQNGNNSFRVEIGSISRRRDTSGRISGNVDHSGDRRTYSVGEFEYVIDEGYEVPAQSMTHRRGSLDDKEVRFAPSAPEIPPEELAAAVGSSRSWLRDYVDRLGSGRFFTGSSRRSEGAGVVVGEEYRVGEEISEIFSWLSGV